MAVSGKVRATGARAIAGPSGQAEVVSATGAKITLSAALSSPGYSPVDLLYAALAGCLVQSLRIAASEQQLLGRLRNVSADVKGRKAPDAPPRVTHLDIDISVEGDFDEATAEALIHRAEALCTVSNTLLGTTEFVVTKRLDVQSHATPAGDP
jgi:uncharacterized OsmC-like protein